MTIAFDQIPAGTLVPFTYFEAAAAPAPYNACLKLLLIGHLTPGPNGAGW
jgi:hypothetical protein